jgi:hypothetical protein
VLVNTVVPIGTYAKILDYLQVDRHPSTSVGEGVWEECAGILRERSNGHKPGPRPVHLFTGLRFLRLWVEDVRAVELAQVDLLRVPEQNPWSPDLSTITQISPR